MSDDFVEQWRSQLTDSLVHVAQLAPQAPEVDFASGLLATGILWPVREPVQDFDGDAIDAIRAIAGPQSKHILRAVQTWDDDQLSAARALALAAAENAELAEALRTLVTHFDAANMLSARLGTMPPEVVNQIKAALVNIGGIINIQSLTLNVAHTVEIPPPPRPDRPPELDEFVGRARELAYYAEMLASHHLAVITGMAGVGKTALAAALARQTSQASDIFWHSFREREGIEVIIWKLAAFLAWHGQEDLWHMLQSARQTGGQPPPPETLFDYVLQLIEGRNYLLCFDDLHLVEDDPLLNQLVDRLRAALVAGRLSLVITARRVPSFVQTVEADSLSGLNAEDTQQLFSRWGLQLPESLFDRLYAHTGGNAQFMTLAMNVLHHEPEPARAIDRLVESDNIERYLLSEVEERLTDQEREVMGAVAVLMGYPGSQDAIEAVLDAGRHGDSPQLRHMRRTLRQLADRHLLIASQGALGREYQQHAMVQAFYYDLLSRARRRAMHLQAAAFYETDEPNILRAAVHHERGGNYLRSAQLATQNLWALINQGQIRSMRHLLEQFSAAQLEAPPPLQGSAAFGPAASTSSDALNPASPTSSGALNTEWIHVNLALGQICHMLAESQQARAHYQEALDRLEGMDESPAAPPPLSNDSPIVNILRTRALRGMAQLVYNEKPQEALNWLQRAFDELARAGEQVDQQIEAALYIDMGWAHRRLHNLPDAMDALQCGLERLPQGPSQLRGDALTRLVALYVAQYDLENARGYAQMAIDNSRHLRDVWHEQTVLNMLGNIKHLENDWQGAIQEYERALAIAKEIGDRVVHAAMEVNLGVAHANLGNPEPALAHLTNGLNLSQQSNLRNYELKAQLAVARVHTRLHNWGAAEHDLDAAEALVEQAGSADAQFHLPLILSARAELRLLSGKIDEALSIAEQSVALSIEQNKQVDLAVCQRVKAQILLAGGEVEQAQTLLEQSLSLLTDRHRFESAKIKALLGQALHRCGDRARGDELIAEARTIFTSYDAKFELADLAHHATIEG